MTTQPDYERDCAVTDRVLCLVSAVVQAAVVITCSISWRCLQTSWLIFGKAPLPWIHQWVLTFGVQTRFFDCLAWGLLVLAVVLVGVHARRRVLLSCRVVCILVATAMGCITFVCLAAMSFTV